MHFIQFPLPGLNRMNFTALTPSTEQTLFFMTPALRDADPARTHFVPIHMRRVIDFLRDDAPDVALLQVAADREGELRLAANADFAAAAMADPATQVVALVNSGFTAPAGAPVLPAERIDTLVEGASEVPVFPAPVIDDAARAIAGHVAGLIEDGDCLQTGIGAIPAAVLAALAGHRDLGFHGGLVDDGVLALIEAGALTGARKTRDPGVHVTGMALGSPELLAALAGMPEVRLCGADYTHEASVIAGIDRFVSINSAVQVDLAGQINGEFAGGRQISGTGGSVDFMRASRGSTGGRSIVALPATARGGSVSRIVAGVEQVTALRTDVDLVVTEYGVAHLRDRPLPARAAALVEVAAPEFRAALTEAAGL